MMIKEIKLDYQVWCKKCGEVAKEVEEVICKNCKINSPFFYDLKENVKKMNESTLNQMKLVKLNNLNKQFNSFIHSGLIVRGISNKMQLFKNVINDKSKLKYFRKFLALEMSDNYLEFIVKVQDFKCKKIFFFNFFFLLIFFFLKMKSTKRTEWYFYFPFFIF